MFRLEQNYRSTATILKAANALIANNSGRLGKTLWTKGEDGEAIKIYAAFNERDEADFVVNRIRDWAQRNGARRDIAILYRSNAQSRVFEEAFLNARIPYRVYGGLRFFERAEIKDALAYLRLTASRADDTSFERVVNLPTRGIGAKTMDLVRSYARANATSLWVAAGACIATELAQKGGQALHAFLILIEKLAKETENLELHEKVDHVIQASGLIEHYKKEKGERGEARLENLECGARICARGRDGLGTTRFVSCTRCTGIGRGAGRCLGRLCANDDAAYSQGARVSGGIYVRHGRRAIPASAFDFRYRESGGGTAALLCGHHPCDAPAVRDLCGAAPPARYRYFRAAVAFYCRVAAGTGRGSPAAAADI
jgi:ATP-dependent exoDNAse (exonuclease V) beta subunit